jgi:hypothetical protein
MNPHEEISLFTTSRQRGDAISTRGGQVHR